MINYELQYKKIKNLYIQVKEGRVIVKVPKRAKKEYINKFIERHEEWIIQKLKESKEKKAKEDERVFKEEDYNNLKEKLNAIFPKFIKLTGEKPNKISIKKVKTAWGSCTGKRNIMINIKLVDKSDKEIEYVVLHELCHLKYMNHSKDFWNMVSKYMPDHKEIRKKLKS